MQFFHIVRRGETVFQISKRWEIPVKSLIAANNLQDPYTIFVGQQLSIPPGIDVYSVKSEDSVYQIAQLYGVPISFIIEANQLKPPYILKVNQKLTIPRGFPYYVVQQGDTLNRIAQRFNVTTEGQNNIKLLQDVNKLSTTTINPGMKLIIPYAPTGDKGYLAYTSNRAGHYDIWTYNPRNGVNKKLTNELGDSFSKPVWSPDSTKIAFVGKNRIIYVIYVETGLIAGIDQLSEGGDFSLDWSPNSTKLAYGARGIILLYDVLSHIAQTIDQPGATDIRWFPNGTELLFQALDRSGISQLYRFNIIESTKKQITNNTDGPLHNIRLSPDGTFALYTTPGASISIIHTVNLATGQVYEVKGGPEAKNYFPVWSPDSQRIAYSATFLENNNYFSQIRTVGRQGKEDSIWAISNCFSTPVTWSPDGGEIAYLSGCNEQEYAREMWVVKLSHPVPIQLIDDGTIQSLQWSPTQKNYLDKKEYTNDIFNVSFKYPASWSKVNDERYEGSGGFFQISAIFGSENIEEVCHDEAFQDLMPYGSTPVIKKAIIPNLEACIIFPSSDQPAEMKEQAAFIAKYPTPIEINEESYNYFILWADKSHIEDIVSSVQFSA